MLYLAGLIYSKNIDYGLKDVETKLSLLIFPLIYFSSEKPNKPQLQSILNAFIKGCLASAIICFSYALYQYISTKYTISQGKWAWNYGINFFLKDRLSIWIHPSYRAMYFVLALAIIYFQRNKKGNVSFWQKYFIPLILSFFVLLFNSKAGIITLSILGVMVCQQIVFKEKKIKLALTGMLAAVLLFLSLYFAAPQFAIRIDEAVNSLTENVDVKKSENSTASRMALWNAAKVVISENWMIGTGTGDVKDALFKEYEKEGMSFALQENLNAHNQFLQTFASLGIPGVLNISLILLFPLLYSFKKRNYIYMVFLLMIIINFSVESMLETQAGVIFYAFFNFLLLFSFSQEEKI